MPAVGKVFRSPPVTLSLQLVMKPHDKLPGFPVIDDFRALNYASGFDQIIILRPG
jgi:hypothetical protein